MGKEVDCFDSIKFLGCVIDKTFSWHAHVTYTCNRISRGIALLRHVRNFFPEWVKRLMYFDHIYPHTCYCLAVWVGADLNRVLVIQKMFV